MSKRIEQDISAAAEDVSRIVISEAGKGAEYEKIVMRPVLIKGERFFQAEQYKDNKVFHQNIPIKNAGAFVAEKTGSFRQVRVSFSDTAKHYFVSPSGKVKVTEEKLKGGKKEINLSHDREKNFILREGDEIPALVELGIFTKDFRVVRSMYDKFKQVNRFVEIVDDVISAAGMKTVRVADFGCGKSYLTFVLYHYLTKVKGIDAVVTGYDLKADVIAKCNAIKEKYDCKNLHFIKGDIRDAAEKGVDMVVSLHACDTATDHALAFCIKNNVKYIFCAPCCQHEINSSISVGGGDFDFMTESGLVKERFSALLTDTLRAEVLRAYGYKTDVMEFVDFTHSPKNIMLRARKTTQPADLSRVAGLMEKYGFRFTLYDLVK